MEQGKSISRKIVTAISTDTDITDEEALKIAERLKEITKDMLNGEDKDNEYHTCKYHFFSNNHCLIYYY
ncbi:MAG: hypothetical protein IIY08_05655 [Cellulosilyticum sp.]|nr:hypothetical protein [Cellulosilyticum sp.]